MTFEIKVPFVTVPEYSLYVPSVLTSTPSTVETSSITKITPVAVGQPLVEPTVIVVLTPDV